MFGVLGKRSLYVYVYIGGQGLMAEFRKFSWMILENCTDFEVLRWIKIIIHYLYFSDEGCEYSLHRMVKCALYTNGTRHIRKLWLLFIAPKFQGNKELVKMKYVILK